MNLVRTLPSADEILCLSAPQPLANSASSSAGQGCWSAIENTHNSEPVSGMETDQGEILGRFEENQRQFEARERKRRLIAQ